MIDATKARIEMGAALTSLYLNCPDSVAMDVEEKVRAAITELRMENLQQDKLINGLLRSVKISSEAMSDCSTVLEKVSLYRDLAGRMKRCSNLLKDIIKVSKDD